MISHYYKVLVIIQTVLQAFLYYSVLLYVLNLVIEF